MHLHIVRQEHTSSPSVHRLTLWLCTHAAWQRKSVCGQMCAHAQSTLNLRHSQHKSAHITARDPVSMSQLRAIASLACFDTHQPVAKRSQGCAYGGRQAPDGRFPHKRCTADARRHRTAGRPLAGVMQLRYQAPQARLACDSRKVDARPKQVHRHLSPANGASCVR